MRPRAILLLAAAAAALAGCGGGSSSKPHPIVVGAVEDAAKFGAPAAKMSLARDAAYGAVVLSAIWKPGLEAPSDLDALTIPL